MFQGGHIEEMICMFRCYCEVINKDQQSMQKIESFHSESGKLKVRIGIFENNAIKHVIM